MIPIALAAVNPTDLGGVKTIIQNIATGFSGIVLAVAAVYLMWGAFKYITAKGEKGSIDTAKSTILYAVIGIVIAAIAYSLPTIIQNIVGSQVTL